MVKRDGVVFHEMVFLFKACCQPFKNALLLIPEMPVCQSVQYGCKEAILIALGPGIIEMADVHKNILSHTLSNNTNTRNNMPTNNKQR